MIRVGIVGYGNIGKGVLSAIRESEDCEAVALFTRRNPEHLEDLPPNIKAVSFSEIERYKGKVDVLILCGGSKNDLPHQGPQIAEMFSIIDSFDTHAAIPEYLSKVNEAAKKGGSTAIISSGWDPGLFSMMRLISQSVLPNGLTYTFWGRGVSQGHSDAIRTIDGVEHGVQYTVPMDSAVEAVRLGINPELAPGEKHKRVCYVAPKEGADLDKIAAEIKNMPNYFADYDTTVNFVPIEELAEKHSKMPHGGRVIHSGATALGRNKQLIEFSLNLDSNPEFTGSIMVAFARAAARMSRDGKSGGFTPFDIPIYYLSPRKREDLIKDLL